APRRWINHGEFDQRRVGRYTALDLREQGQSIQGWSECIHASLPGRLAQGMPGLSHFFSQSERDWMRKIKSEIEVTAESLGKKVTIIWPCVLMTQSEIKVFGQRAKGDIFSRCKSHLHDADIELQQILSVPFLNKNRSGSTLALGPVLIETQ